MEPFHKASQNFGEERYSLGASDLQRPIHVWKELLLMPGVSTFSGGGPNLKQLSPMHKYYWNVII